MSGPLTLAVPDARRIKPGYPEEYYALFDGLAKSLPRALAAGLIADKASVYTGETGAVVTVRAGGDQHIVRLAAYDGELYTSAYFYGRLAGLDSCGTKVGAIASRFPPPSDPWSSSSV